MTSVAVFFGCAFGNNQLKSNKTNFKSIIAKVFGLPEKGNCSKSAGTLGVTEHRSAVYVRQMSSEARVATRQTAAF